MNQISLSRLLRHPWILLAAGMALTVAIYAPGLSGGWLFDDYPNIVDNRGVQPTTYDMPGLINAALSSPSSDFKRPLASLSFALNYLATGLDARPMKVTNLIIHLTNGLLVFLLVRALLRIDQGCNRISDGMAVLIATAWLTLSINLTAVLYVVQRMESLANLFVLLGLLGYVQGRIRMLGGRTGFALCTLSIALGTGIGALAKETAIMLPLYALMTEFFVFRWLRCESDGSPAIDRRLIVLFVLILVLPLVAGGVWLTPTILNPETWTRRNFTLATRLLTESRVVVDYLGWIIAPLPEALSFYHDDFLVSRSAIEPWTTLACIVILIAIIYTCYALRRSRPLTSLGIAWYLGCHLLTGTVLPLELIYEHRNYFASAGLLLALFDLAHYGLNFLLVRRAVTLIVAAAFIIWQCSITLMTAQAWGDPLALARELAYRGPTSPRAQYELGRTYVIYSRYDPSSPYTFKAYSTLERAASLSGSSVLPEQALIFMNSRMRRPIKSEWWTSMVKKLSAHPPTVQDESSLESLSNCLREASCQFPAQDLLNVFLAALNHPAPSARLLAMYANFAWSTLQDRMLAQRVQRKAVDVAPKEPSYRIGLARMAAISGDFAEAQRQIGALQSINTGGRLNRDINLLETMLSATKNKSVGVER